MKLKIFNLQCHSHFYDFMIANCEKIKKWNELTRLGKFGIYKEITRKF